MAVEIQKQVHLYIPPPPEKKSKDRNTRRTDSPFVVHNFEHDMESIFWLLLWTLLVRFPYNGRSAFASTLSIIFRDSSICSPEREGVFTQGGRLCNLLANLLAPQLESIQAPLDDLRDWLLTGYLAREHNFDDLSSYSSLYEWLRATLKACQRLTREQVLPDLLPCRSPYQGRT